MAQEFSFDVVSKVDLQEVSNAVQQASKEIATRFDFRGSKSKIEWNEKELQLTLTSDDEHKLKSRGRHPRDASGQARHRGQVARLPEGRARGDAARSASSSRSSRASRSRSPRRSSRRSRTASSRSRPRSRPTRSGSRPAREGRPPGGHDAAAGGRLRRAAAVHQLSLNANARRCARADEHSVPHRDVRLLRAYDLIADKLAKVEEELLLHFRSPIPTIDRMGSYLAQGGGKRIRPALLLLSARLLDYGEDEGGAKDVRYAAVVEFIHTATLVHDDIIDEARLRRGRTSANARWGNNLTVLFGDYLYTMSMGIALDEGDLTILKLLSDTTLSMIEGEILGMEKEGSVHVTREEALEITRRKTADLFAAACRLPAHFAPRGDLVAAERLGEYGRCLGHGVPAHRRPARLHRKRARGRQARA